MSRAHGSDTAPASRPLWQHPLTLVALYAILAIAWFGTAEHVGGNLFGGASERPMRMALGALFIVASGALLLLLLRSTQNVRNGAQAASDRHHRLPLLVQLLALVFAIVVPLLGLLGYVVFENARQASRISRSVALDLAVVTAAESERFLQSVRAQIDEIGARPQIRAMDPANCDPILAQYRLLNPTFTAIVLFDTAGNAICPRRPASGPHFTNYAGSDWFREIIEHGTGKLREPYIGPVSRKWIVAYLAPVRDASGKVFAVIDISFDLRQFQPVAQQKLVSGATLTLVDSGAVVVADSADATRVGQTARGQLLARAQSGPERTDFIDVALKARTGEGLAVSAVGEPRIVGYAPVAGTDWIAIASVPSEQAFALSVASSLTWVVPIVLLGLLLVWLIARAIERPIRAIADAAADMAQGREPRLAPEAGSSETSQVARRFNVMVQTLDASQQALQDSESRFRALTMLSSDWFWELDADLRITEISGVESPALAARRATLIGLHPWEMTGQYGVRDPVWASLRVKLEAHEPVRDFEFAAVLDAERRRESHFSASGEPRFDGTGRFLGYRGVTRNISKRKAAELATRESELRFRSLTELSADWYWEQDCDARFTGVFRSPLFPTGAVPPHDMIGKRPWEIPGAMMDDAAWAPLRDSVAARRPYFDFEFRIGGRDGRPRIWASSGIPFFRADGTMLGYRGITRDVTEHRHLEQQLGLFEMAVRQSNDMILLVKAREGNAEPTVVFANPAYCRTFGFSADELVGKPARAPEGPRTDRDLLADMAARLREGKPFASETWAYRRYGEPFALEFRIDPLLDACGKTTHFIFVLRDVTERREAADRLAQLNASLEENVQARTRELEDTLREYEAFSYSVSHDLRGPLRGISGFSRILHDEHLPPEDRTGREYLERVMSATQKMGLMIDAMLELGQISRMDLRRQPVDLSALAREIIATLQRESPRRSVDFICGDGMVCEGDPTLLRSVLDNLLGNAWKYSARREVAHIEFVTTQTAWGDTYLVRDNGAGFEMANARRLFSPFQRMHGKEFPGTGVGLATVQRILRRHGGRIWAQSSPDKGASFFFTLWEPHNHRHDAQTTAV